MRRLRSVGLLLFLLCLMPQSSDTVLAQATVTTDAGIAFRIAKEHNLYAIYMVTTSTPIPGYLLAAQVTVKVPHQEGNQSFQVADLQSAVPGVFWGEGGRVNAPIADPTADYISFILNPVTLHTPELLASTDGQATMTIFESNPAAIQWQAGKEVKVFTFINSGSEAATVKLLESSDPFFASDAIEANLGNAITILGVDRDNAYIGNYEEANGVDKIIRTFLPLINR